MENKEELQEVKKKGGKGLIVLVILLLLICCGLGAVIFMNKDKLFEKEKEVVEKEDVKEKEESVSFSDDELDEYVGYINPTSFAGPSAAIFDVDKVEASKLSSKEKMNYISSFIFSKATSSQDYRYSILSEEDVKKSVEKVYGPNTYERATFNLGCGDYVFRENEGKYYSETGCGGTSPLFGQNIVIDYNATKEKLEITTAYAFYDAQTNKIYKDYKITKVLDSYEGGEQTKVDNYLEEYIKNNKSKLNTLVYTFESKDGRNYYFTKLVNNR